MPTFSSAKKLALPIALALALAACGSSSPSVAHLKSSAGSHQPSSSTGGADPGFSSSSGSASGGASVTMVLGGGGARKALKFSACMRAHGVPNFPDPSADGSISITGINPQSQQFQDAQNICGKLLPLGKQTASPAQQAQALANALKFSQCMRSHGVTDFPDPQSSGGGVHISLKVSASSGLDPQSPTFQAAQKACQGGLPPIPVAKP